MHPVSYKSPSRRRGLSAIYLFIEDLGELDDLINENFVSEDIVKGFLPKDTLYSIIGGDYNEIF